jgi:hypothetical protein
MWGPELPTLTGMRRPSRLLLALGTTLSLALAASGCSAGTAEDRRPGDHVTEAEAQTLARLLTRNHQRGGADFVVTAPYSDEAMLTLTGEIDFLRSVGRAQAVTSFSEGRADDTRTLFFTPEQVWFGDIPGLAEALAADGATGASYLRRPVTTGDAARDPLLEDVLVELLLNLSARTADQPEAFLGSGYTWLGQRSIDSRLTSVFSLRDGRTVAVAASGDLLTQFVTPLPGTDVDVTVTLSDHGPRRLDLPTDEETAEAGDHPGVAAGFGV